MTHILLLLAVELYLDGWPPIGFGDNLERPNKDTSEGQRNERNKVNLPVLHVILHLFVVELPTDQTLEGGDGVLRVHNCLSLSREANETLAVLGERDDRGCCPCTFGVLDDAGSLALHDGDARVGRSQVNTDNRTYMIVNILG